MNWRLTKACSFAVSADGSGVVSIVKVGLVAALLDRLCIGLCLLKEGLIDSLDLVSTDSDEVFRLLRGVRTTSIKFGKGKIALALDETELERWLHFTLRTVRDGGVAEVDHIDVDAPIEDKGRETATVVVVFPSSAPPVSPDEVRRRLGL
jgi:hypothetical protein